MSLMFHSAILHLFLVITQFSNGLDIPIETECVKNQSTANFPWTYTLSANETVRRITWARITPSVINILEMDHTGVLRVLQSDYTGRVNSTATPTNGKADFQLSTVSPHDKATYRCIVNTGVSNVSTAELDLKVPPVLNPIEVNLTVVANTSTSATLEWKEPPLNGICDEMLTYLVEYRTVQPVSKRAATSSEWVSAGTVRGSAHRNETVSYNVTGLKGGSHYKFSVTANNSIGCSERAESQEALEIITIAFILALIASFVLNVHEGQCLFSIILMTSIMVAEARKHTRTLKCLGSIGPLGGVAMAVVVIVIGLVPNKGNGHQKGFISTMVVAGVAGLLSLGASIAGFLQKDRIGKTLKFPVVTMPLLFSAGLMTSISGTVTSALHVKPGTELPGIIFGAVCIVLLVVVFAWYLYKVCAKGESSKVSQDLSAARSQNQVELEEGTPGSDGKPANPSEPPNDEVKTSDSLTKSVHGKPRMLPPLQLDPPKQKKKNKGKRKKKATEEEKKVTEPGDQPEQLH